MNKSYYVKLLLIAALIVYCCITYAGYASTENTVIIYRNITLPCNDVNNNNDNPTQTVPLANNYNNNNNNNNNKADYVLVVGIPTKPTTTEKRMQIRLTYMTHYKEVYCPYCTTPHPNPKVRIWFFFGKVKEGLELLQAEQRMFGDMVFLNVSEAMNEGKTHEMLSWLVNNTRARFVMKADDDSFLVIPNLVKRLEHYSPRLAASHIYYGFSMFPTPTTRGLFMAGMGYILDFNLTRALVTKKDVRKYGNEDLVVSIWVHEAMDEGANVIQIRNNRHFHTSPHHEGIASWEYNCSDVLLHQVKTTFRFNDAANYYLHCCPPAPKPHRICTAKIKSNTVCINGTLSGIACFPFSLHAAPYTVVDNDVLIQDDELEL